MLETLRRRWRDRVRRSRRERRLAEIRAGKSVLKHGPTTINIEFSGRCNIWPPCTYCVGKQAPNYQEPPHITAEQLAPYWKYLLTAERVNDHTYGEPLMYPQIAELIERLGTAGVHFGFTSNGLLLTEKRAKLVAEHGEHVDLCVSLNAATKETYFAHQGKDFDKVLTNIRRVIAMHRERHPTAASPPIIVSFIVMRSNRHEVFDFIRLGKSLGVRGVMFRHLFDLHADEFTANNFGHHFVYGQERLAFEEYQQIERDIRANPEFSDPSMAIYYAWNSGDSFIKQQAEPGVDIPCLFPWKFLSIRPIHDFYTPCVYLKKGIAKVSETSVEGVWNGPIMRGMREELARGDVPKHCCEHSDMCPLVLEKRARERAAAPPARPGERHVRLPVLSS